VLIVDDGLLYAAADRRDPDHERCARLLQEHAGAPLIVPSLIITEVAYLSGDRNDGIPSTPAAVGCYTRAGRPPNSRRRVRTCSACRRLPRRGLARQHAGSQPHLRDRHRHRPSSSSSLTGAGR
jgi:hypothetical protein